MTDPNLKFHQKTALVTGSGRGIGRAIALHLARLGADVVINYHRNEGPANEVADQIRAMGRRALVVRANLSKSEDINLLFEELEKEFNGLDIFISNAASGFNRPALQQKVSGWDWTMDVNARAFLFASQRAVPLMEKRGGGSIIAISSPGSHRVLPDYVAVGASKAALEALTRYLAVELAPRHIVVNAIAPGMVLTDALQHFASMSSPEVIPNAIANTPTGRLVIPEDVAGVVAFLCSPEASMICGQVLVIDGGFTLPVPK
jgi:enoyl-[acyl-carrier protein] reductase III